MSADTTSVDARMRRVLLEHDVIHVVGLSSNPARASHGVARYLVSAGYDVVPVNPREPEVVGRQAIASLAESDRPVRFVDVFRRSEYLPELTDQILSLGSVEVVWLQLGVRDAQSEARLRAAGIEVFTDECILVAHRRLLG